MRRVLEDDELRSRLEAGAVDQARQFSWERTAHNTLDVYRRARAALLDAAS
jgi:D-inositol-3-phosphate glycosyltransferase